MPAGSHGRVCSLYVSNMYNEVPQRRKTSGLKQHDSEVQNGRKVLYLEDLNDSSGFFGWILRLKHGFMLVGVKEIS